MLYDSYTSKMMRIRSVMDFFKRNCKKILLIFIITVILISSIIALKGTVLFTDFQETIQYGDKYIPKAYAFLDNFNTEFLDSDGVWKENQPTLPGEYKIRCYGTSISGKRRYTDECAFVITKRDIEVSIKENTIVYGEDLTLQAETVYGDSIVCNSFTYADVAADVTEVTPIPEDVKIFNSEGKSVTNLLYNVIPKPKNVTILPRDITLTIPDKEKEYDGLPLRSETFEITSGSVLEGDTVIARFEKSRTEVGSVENTATVTVINSDSQDISHRYRITYDNGSLIVTKRTVYVTTDSITETYDGNNHSANGFAQNSELGLGDTLVAHVAPTFKYVGKHENNMTFSVKGEDGTDKTHNYNIVVEKGTVEILPRKITVTTESESWIYDDEPHRTFNVTADTLVSGDVWEIISAKDITNAGSIENVQEIIIKNAEGDIITENYEIEYVFGTLTVEKRKITLKPADASHVYDGTEQYGGIAETTPDSAHNLLSGHTTVSSSTGAINVGEEDCYLTEVKIFKGDVDVTENYDITAKSGTITITKRPIKIVMEYAEKEYDSLPLTSTKCTVLPFESFDFALVAGHSLTDVTANGSRTNPGESSNALKGYRIVNSDGEDVTDNYEANAVDGILKVVRRKVTVTSETLSKIYDGTPLEYSNSPTITEGTLCAGHYLDMLATASQTDVGSTDNPISGTVRDASGRDVKLYYDIKFVYGKLTVTKRTVSVTTDSITKTYDGNNHSANGFLQNSETVLGDILVPSAAPEFKYVGKHENDMTFSVIGKDGADKTHNYDIVVQKGTIEILPKKITVTTESKSWIYDDEAHQTFDVTADALVSGDFWEIIFATDIISVGNRENVQEVIIKNTDGDITENYEIEYVFGTLTVEKRKITVKPADVSWIYDGIERCGGEAEVTSYSAYSLITGHSIVSSATTAINAGSFTSSITDVKIKKGDTDVTDNYDITKETGSITVERRPINVVMQYAEKEYDSFPLTSTKCDVLPCFDLGLDFALVAGHSLTDVTADGYIITPDEIINNLTGCRIINSDGDDVSENYNAIGTSSTLKVYPRKITVASVSARKIYDGTPLTNNSAPVVIVGSLCPNQYLDMSSVGTITEVGQTENLVEGTVIDASGENIGFCYDITYVYGSLMVFPVPTYSKNTPDIEISPIYIGKNYDGTVLYPENLVVGNPTFCDLIEKGYTYYVSVTGERTAPGIGESAIDSFILYDPEGNDVTHTFNIIKQKGILEVYDSEKIIKTVRVYAYKLQKYYDGTPLSFNSDDYEIISIDDGLNLVINFNISLFESEQYLTANTLNTTADFYSAVKVYQGSTDVSKNYRIIFDVFETLPSAYLTARLDRRIIEITANSVTKEYDEDNTTPLVCDGYKITLGDLVEGHRIKEIKYSGELTGIGSAVAKIESVVIVDENGNDVTENYEIIKLNGCLEITESQKDGK